jgi:hypothetical protein
MEEAPRVAQITVEIACSANIYVGLPTPADGPVGNFTR